MALPENRHLRFFLILAYVLVAIAGGYLFIKYVFPLLIPFIIAFLLSRLIEPLVRFLTKTLRIPRNIASAICTMLAVFFVGFLLYILSVRLIYELRGLSSMIPSLLNSLPEKLSSLSSFFDRFLENMPQETVQMIQSSIDNFTKSLSIPSSTYHGIFSGITSAAASLPTILISLIAIIVGTYFLSSDRDNISAFIKRQLPPSALDFIDKMKKHIIFTIGRWIKAQLFLIFITFCELTIGFLILNIQYSGALALIISLIDALPILGVGTVLIPWGVIALVSGDYTMAFGLIILYAVILIVRNTVEPKIVGAQIGLHPFVTLLSIYLGFRIFGFLGMFLFPLIVITLIQLQKWGYLPLWK